MLWVMGTAIQRMLTRSTHQTESITTMGTMARPAPRSTAERQWVAASRQKKRAQIWALSTPKAMAA